MLTQAQLEKFCTKAKHLTPSGTDIQLPIRHEGYIYATDARICIRVVDDGTIQAVDPSGRMKGYDFAKLFSGEENVDLPIPTLPDRIVCPHCNGDCLEHYCQTCDGVGQVEEDIGICLCQDCSGTRMKPTPGPEACWWCNGRGEKEHNPVEIGGTYFNRVFLALAAELPDAHFVRIEGNTTARIKFEGGEIAIMPTRMSKP